MCLPKPIIYKGKGKPHDWSRLSMKNIFVSDMHAK